MFDAKDALFVLLAGVTVFYLGFVFKAARRARGTVPVRPTPAQGGVGFVTGFFDTLGIGSFATTTTFFKLRKMVDVREIPGTLNVGHTLPTITEAFIYTRIVPVDSRTLVLMIVAAVAGAWLGAGVVARWPRRKIQIGMGLALVAAAALMLMSQLHMVPAGGQTLSLTGTRLAIGLAGNFALGVLMTLGIGLYAPCMILVSLLGMNPIAAFPIMMGSCAFLMPVCSARFIRERSFNLQAALGLAIGAVPGVLIAALIVKSLPLAAVRWLVVVVVVYTGLNMLLTVRGEAPDVQPAPSSAVPLP
ncbi:MAG TPA: sulfite exporter TauE/SafE family protein [Vicinamibacterales bacterium]|nr:sulfite exporter TauE/SafE family protein [Vicinamibacterales bacterium]